ncbi:MAG: hypothetical protein HC904_09710 [Blastochloris sp.]|nr:hypothetical protein [Blastochloris sp.]
MNQTSLLRQVLAEPQRPIFRVAGVAVDATLALILAHVLVMLLIAGVAAVAPDYLASQSRELGARLTFDSATFHWQAPQGLFLYAFIHDIRSEHVLFVVEMALFFFSGRNLEHQIGRAAFIIYYAVLIYVTPLLLLALGGLTGLEFRLSSSFYATVTLCLAYLTLSVQPRWPVGEPLKKLTWGLVAFCAVFLIAQQEWHRLAYLGVSLGLSCLYLEGIGAGWGAGVLYWFKPCEALMPLSGAGESSAEEKEWVREQVDHLLEKISREGMAALTSREREYLHEASRKWPELF